MLSVVISRMLQLVYNLFQSWNIVYVAQSFYVDQLEYVCGKLAADNTFAMYALCTSHLHSLLLKPR